MTHILAISGLHVAVFLYGLHIMLRWFRLSRETVMNLMIAAVPFYVLLSGASPSVVRAGIMAMIGLMAAKLGMLKDGLHLLCAAAWLMLAADPYMLGNISYQMSVIVTAGLIVGVRPLRACMPVWQRGNPLLDLIAVSVAAQLASFPLTVYYFNQFNLISLPANLLLVPFISSIVMPIGAVSLVLTAVWQPAAEAAAVVARLGNELTFMLADYMNQPDALRTIWPSPPLWWLLAWYALLLLGYRALAACMAGRAKVIPVAPPESAAGAEAPTVPLGTGTERAHPEVDRRSSPYNFSKWAVRGWSRPAVQAAGGVVLFALLLVYAYEPARLDQAAYIEMIDVGQGDALLIRTPEGRHILNDGGGTVRFSRPGEAWRERKEPYEVGRKLLVPLLKKRGVQQIDLLIVSHLDTDHIGGLTAVLEDIPVKRLLWNGSIRDAAEVKMMFAAAAARDVPVYPACAPQIWQPEAHVKVEVLWPPAAGTAGCDRDVTSLPLVKEQNEYSVVAMLELYGYRVLLTGDIGAPTERLLLESLRLRDEAPGGGDPYAGSGGRQADIVKIAHHGSRHSTTEEWLAYWQPRVALIPVGRTNWYGHPHPTVMERLGRHGLQVLRTDRDGGVMLRITEKGIEHRTKIQQ
ncbi:ComEC/Rec2 family competence protein [Paenibacillus sp. 1P07SE]|uniref:ComEC/Rec2 family competence protein n=1 Tax=Paenibacillus sp. 1P07SE TaxID=3132209 RepID=UPI0039A65AE0